LLPTAGLFSKKKERKVQKLIWEYLMDEAVHEVLGVYEKKNRGKFYLSAPKSKYIKEDGSFIMTYCPGMIIKEIPYQGDALRPFFEKFCYTIGAFCKIKENEKIIHGDAAPRHFIYNTNGKVYVIDWEKGRTAGPEEVKKENKEILSWLRIKIENRICQKSIDNNFYDGYNGVRGKNKNAIEKIKKQMEEKYNIVIDLEKRAFTLSDIVFKVD
jgi:tRNA A-37 threonylcarbamoyl transferase component Bud32